LLGQAQQTAFTGGLNTNYNQALQGLMGNLAKRGALNSGAAGTAQAGLLNNKLNSQSQYLAQAPVQNRQYADTQFQNVLGQAGSYKPIFGQTTQGANNQTSLTDISNWLSSMMNSSQNQNTSTTQSTTEKKGGTGLLGKLF